MRIKTTANCSYSMMKKIVIFYDSRWTQNGTVGDTHPPRIDPYNIYVYQTYATEAKMPQSGTCIMFLDESP